MDSAGYGSAGDRLTYGNYEGRDLLEEKHEMKAVMKRLEAKVDSLEAKAKVESTELRAQITRLEHRVDVLTQASEGYRKIRHRFLDVFVRDILKREDKQGSKRLKEGNQAAHEADAIADAALYVFDKRSDEDVLFKIYGLSATQISRLADAGQREIITTLNAGATLRTKRIFPTDVNAAFEKFVQEILANDGNGVTDPTSPLGRAYWAFWAAHNAWADKK